MYKKINDIPNTKKYIRLSAIYGYQKAYYKYGLICYDDISIDSELWEKENAINYLKKASWINKNVFLYIGFKFRLMII